ncbi:MAG: tripartite tricarboxylate transporter permease, partial [Planctomycetales bacterium]
MSDAFLTALENTLTLKVLVVILVSASYGLFVGAIPGLTATMAVALMVPFTFFLDPVSGLAAIVTMEACCIFAGDIPTTLMRIPGTPSSAAYVDDAYSLTQQGRHQQALGVSLVYSVIGGLVGALVLIFLAPRLARIAYEFSSYEYFWLCVLGLSCAAVVSRGSIAKGLIALSIGLLLSCVGLGSTHSVPRLTFGFDELITGINFIPAMIGLFGLAEVLRNFGKLIPDASVVTGTTDAEPTLAKGNWLSRGINEVFGGLYGRVIRSPFRILASSGIGACIGMLPGAGADIAAWVSYAVSKKRSVREGQDPHCNGLFDNIANWTMLILLVGIPCAWLEYTYLQTGVSTFMRVAVALSSGLIAGIVAARTWFILVIRPTRLDGSNLQAPWDNREIYGKGSLDGIADATTANNASLAGAWIPALVLGIP